MRTTTRHPFGPDNPLNPGEVRLLRGPYTLAELSQILNVRLTSIQLWEKGTNHPTMGNLRDLLKHYNNWTSELAGPALDLVLPQRPKRRKAKPCRASEST